MKITATAFPAALLLCLLLSTPPAIASGLTEAAKEGEKLISTCTVCHDADRQPPLGPPLFGVKNRYLRMYPDRDSFVAAIREWATEPSESKALMREPLRQFGLMPPMPLPEDMLNNIASFIFETDFPPPCAHWRTLVEEAEKSGRVDRHIQMEKRNLERFCGN
ncbi:MAG: hypothetical protein KDJ38_06670 [Gammaproteobacteria bacterium]|nr:hypothetical protein [Gammaproteobacteria bacterium]